MATDIDKILKNYKQGRREDLIPILQKVQEEEGYLSEETIVGIGKFLGLSTTKIFGLATFYDKFRFIPSGKIKIKICNGTSCFLNGSHELINKLEEVMGIKAGQTTRDGNFSYEIVSCMGGCNNGPVITIDDRYYINVKPEHIPDLIAKLKYIIEID